MEVYERLADCLFGNEGSEVQGWKEVRRPLLAADLS